MRPLAVAITLLLCSSASGQKAIIVDLGNGNYIGVALGADGSVVTFNSIQWIRPDNPPPPPPPPPPNVTWKVEGLHVLIVDDENLRGNLPAEQVQIFSSKPLKDWLTANAKYRFSSNDSLKPGQPARELETPVFVAGWDLVSSAVGDGKQKLPVLLVSNGRKQSMESLPSDVAALLDRLEEFK